nr:pilus assembly protein PilM [Nitrospirales bacterium]
NVQRQYPDEYPSASVQILWEPFLDEISEQIRDAISEYSSFMNFSSLIAVVLSGGYAAVGGMDEKLSQKLRVPVRLLNPFNRIEVPVHIAQDPSFLSALPLLGVAVGVALRGGREA